MKTLEYRNRFFDYCYTKCWLLVQGFMVGKQVTLFFTWIEAWGISNQVAYLKNVYQV